MKTWIVEEAQGSPEWNEGRKTRRNASDLACAMGIDPNGRSREELVKELALGIEREFSDYVQERVIKPGHEIEAAARVIIEQRTGKSLYPVVLAGELDGITLGASLDGITIDDSETFECKRKNAALWAAVISGVIPKEYHPQMEQGLWLSGAEVCLFTVSDGTEENTVSVEYRSDQELRAKIIPTWKQLEEDVRHYQHVEVIPAAVAAPIKDLPAIVITASGSLTIETNFARWGVELREFIAKIPERPENDQEFADCKAAIEAFKKAEKALDSEETRVLSMVTSIEEMQREKKLLFDLSRSTRLSLEKLVVSRDLAVKAEIIQSGKDQLTEYVAKLNDSIGGNWVPAIAADFAQAIKNKRSYESMRSSVADMVAQKKVEANGIADRINTNRQELVGELDWSFLFPDWVAVCAKPCDDFAALLSMRVTNHRASEEKRMEAEREKIRSEEKAKADAEAKAKADLEQSAIDRKRAELAEQQRQENEMRMQEINAIGQQVIIAQIGRQGVRVGGTIQCIEETLAETEKWIISEDNFGPLTGMAHGAKDRAIVQIKAMLYQAKQAEAQAKDRAEQAERDAEASSVRAAEQAELEKQRAKLKEESDALARQKSEAEEAKAIADEKARIAAAEKVQIAANEPVITPEEQRAAVIEHQDDIARFMATRDWGAEKGKVRAILVEFVKFQAQ